MDIKQAYELWPSEEECLEFVATARWEEGVICPSCGRANGSIGGWSTSRRCRNAKCGAILNPFAGTFMKNTKLDARTIVAFVSSFSIIREKNVTDIATEFDITRRTASSLIKKTANGLANGDSLARSLRDTVIHESDPVVVSRAINTGKLSIGDLELECHVLEDERRVFSGRNITTALSLKSPGTGGLVRFFERQFLKKYVPESLLVALRNPVQFQTKSGFCGHAFEADILVDICDVITEAMADGAMKIDSHKRVAKQCLILTKSFARVGVIALIDEATGYQELRGKRALADFLEKFISKELAKWTKVFPDEFYAQIFRLRRWNYSTLSTKPSVVGKWTNDIVYSRLAPGLLDELKKLNPVTGKGFRAHKHHQHLTEHTGYPSLKAHLEAVIALMKISDNWEEFLAYLDKAKPVVDVEDLD